MAIKLKSGYSRATIQSNLTALLRDGFDRNGAIRVAFNAARASFFKANKRGALPEWLAFPKHHRTFQYYLDNGSPIREMPREENPVGELDISDEEMEEIKNDVQKQLTGQGADVRKAAALYTEFTGHEEIDLTKVSVAQFPKVACVIGDIDGILYSTIRDGVPEKYIHKFKKSARPLFVVSPDGKQLIMLGGAFDFTERGIVDK